MRKTIQSTFAALFVFLLTPVMLFATGTGGSFGGSLKIVDIGRKIIGFLSGPAGIIIITLGIIGGGIAIVFGKQRDQAGYRKIGQTLVGGSIIVAAASLVGFFFSGAMI